MNRAVRVLLDVNIFVGNIIAHDRGHQGTATQTLVDMVSSHRWGLKDKAQLIVSFEMIDTLVTVSTSCNGCAWAWILRRLLFGRSYNRLDNAA